MQYNIQFTYDIAAYTPQEALELALLSVCDQNATVGVEVTGADGKKTEGFFGDPDIPVDYSLVYPQLSGGTNVR